MLYAARIQSLRWVHSNSFSHSKIISAQEPNFLFTMTFRSANSTSAHTMHNLSEWVLCVCVRAITSKMSLNVRVFFVLSLYSFHPESKKIDSFFSIEGTSNAHTLTANTTGTWKKSRKFKKCVQWIVGAFYRLLQIGQTRTGNILAMVSALDFMLVDLCRISLLICKR